MNHYTVFDPDDGTGYTYRWHGGLTVNVYRHGEHYIEADRDWYDVPVEVDVFTLGIGHTNRPHIHDVEEAVEHHHARVLAELAEDEPSDAFVEGYSHAYHGTDGLNDLDLSDEERADYWRGVEAGNARYEAEQVRFLPAR